MISGIETVHFISMAAPCSWPDKLSEDLSTPFLELLAKARSNLPEQGDGRSIDQN